MPRATDPMARESRGGSKSHSIFRGRPGAETHNSPLGDDDSPQKILMSLRTPSHSFEEQPRKKDDPLSPEAPPKIQHSHNQNPADSNLKFDVSYLSWPQEYNFFHFYEQSTQFHSVVFSRRKAPSLVLGLLNQRVRSIWHHHSHFSINPLIVLVIQQISSMSADRWIQLCGLPLLSLEREEVTRRPLSCI
jgi:hypothetical protein